MGKHYEFDQNEEHQRFRRKRNFDDDDWQNDKYWEEDEADMENDTWDEEDEDF